MIKILARFSILFPILLIILITSVILINVGFGYQVVTKLAVATNSPILCEITKVTGIFDFNAMFRGEDVATCYLEVAIQKNTPEACSKTGGKQSYCYQKVAIQYDNMALCKLIDESDSTAGSCYGFFMKSEQDKSICEGLISKDTRSACFMYYVRNVNPDLSICEGKVENNGIPYKDHCYSVVARAEKDVLLCERISPGISKEECKRGASRQSQ